MTDNDITGSFRIAPKPETVERLQEPYSSCGKVFTRRWALKVTQQRYAQILTRLQYDQLKSKQLAEGLIELYLSDDEDFLRCLDKIKDRFQKRRGTTKSARRKIERAREKSIRIQEEFGIREKDVSDLYSILEKDLPLSFVEDSGEKEEIERKKKK